MEEVPHAAEVPKSLKRGRNSRCSRDRYKDIHLTEGDLESYGLWVEKSAEAIVATGNEPIIVGGLTR